MALKAGDIATCRVRLLTTAGAAAGPYADKAAFLAAGFTVAYDVGGVGVTPAWTFAVVDNTIGTYDILLTTQLGDGFLTVKEPAGLECWPSTRPVSVEAYNFTSLQQSLIQTAGSSANQDRQTVNDFDVEEGDSFLRTVTVPTTALGDWGYTDLNSGGWTVSAAARKRVNRLAASPDFVLGAYIVDAVNRIVAISLNPFADGAKLSASDPADILEPFDWELQLKNTKTAAITAVNQGAKKFTVSGDLRKYLSLNTSPATQVTIAGSTGNNGTYTVVSIALNGANTDIVVSQAVPSAVADGTMSIPIQFSSNKGVINVNFQVDRT